MHQVFPVQCGDSNNLQKQRDRQTGFASKCVKRSYLDAAELVLELGVGLVDQVLVRLAAICHLEPKLKRSLQRGSKTAGPRRFRPGAAARLCLTRT